MINAQLGTGANGTEVLAQFFTDEGETLFVEPVVNEAEARRRVYFHNRNLIADKFIHWLGQRHHAMKLSIHYQKPIQLKLLIESQRYTSLQSLVYQIRQRMQDFEDCIPSVKSPARGFYDKEISYIMDFCKNARV